MENELDMLHDAILVSVSMDWSEGNAVVAFRLGENPTRDIEIHVANSTLLHCPRQSPWGKSQHTNEVRIKPLPDSRQKIEVEIQSGDLLEIEGATVEILGASESGPDAGT